MLRMLAILCFIVVLFPVSASAQWKLGPGLELLEGTTSAFGVSTRGYYGLGVTCKNGQPYVWTQVGSAQGGAIHKDSFAIVVDGQSFTINADRYPGDAFWGGDAPAGLVDALKSSSLARVEATDVPPVQFRLNGSARALNQALSKCGAADRSTPTTANQNKSLQSLIETACGGGYTLRQGAKITANLDADNVPDTILDWAGVTCDDKTKGRGAGFCGAALCVIEVALTQTQNRQQILGVQPKVIARGFGRQALQTTTMGQTCGGPAQTCDVIWRWTGSLLEANR